MKTQLLTQLFVIVFLAFACNKEDDSGIDPNYQNVGKDEISAIDTKLLGQIRKAGDLFEAMEIWDSFKLNEYPLYLIHKNKLGKIDRGIIVNPQSMLLGAKDLDQELNAGLDAYRYDRELDRAWEVLTNPDVGNELYDSNFEIDGKRYYLQVYNDKEVKAGENLARYPGGFFDRSTVTIGAIDFIINQNFWVYQESWNSRRVPIDPDIEEFRMIASKVLELKTVLHQIFKNFPNVDLNHEELEKKLKQYVAIQSQLDTVNFDPFTETLEGSARYTERMAIRNIFPKRANEPFIQGTVLEDDYGITNQRTLNMVFDIALTYEIGASVCYILSQVDATALKQIENGSNLFDIVLLKYKLTDQQLLQYVQDAKNSVDWNAVQTKVQRWQTLQ